MSAVCGHVLHHYSYSPLLRLKWAECNPRSREQSDSALCWRGLWHAVFSKQEKFAVFDSVWAGCVKTPHKALWLLAWKGNSCLGALWYDALSHYLITKQSMWGKACEITEMTVLKLMVTIEVQGDKGSWILLSKEWAEQIKRTLTVWELHTDKYYGSLGWGS